MNTCDNFQQQNFYNLFHYEVCSCKSKLAYPRQNYQVVPYVNFSEKFPIMPLGTVSSVTKVFLVSSIHLLCR